MNKITIALQSPATWAIIGAVLAGALNALVPFLHGSLLTDVQNLLSIYALLATPHEIQKAGRAGQAGSIRY